MIPKCIHYVWVGGKLPDEQSRNIDTWRETNPDFELMLWNEHNIDFSHPILRQAYEKRLWAKVADIVRLQAIAGAGGFYFDTDFRLCRSLAPLLGQACVLGFQSEQPSPDWVANGMLAAEPGHWFINLALQRLLALRPVPFGLDRPTRYGPKLVTRLLIEHGLDRYDPAGVQLRDVFVCPTDAFFPWPHDQPFREDFITPRAYGIHLWEKSWETSVPAWVRFAKRVRAHARATLRRYA